MDAAVGRSRELGPLHLVNAWTTANRLDWGQVAVDGKSNDITAIPTCSPCSNCTAPG